MKQIKAFVIVSITIFFLSCSQRIVSDFEILKKNNNTSGDFVILCPDDDITISEKDIGYISLKDNGFSKNRDFETAISLLESKSKEKGGNLLRIINYSAPTLFGSPCHKIDADVYYVNDLSAVKNYLEKKYSNSNNITLNIFRHNSNEINTEIRLLIDSTNLCRVSNNFAQTFEIKNEKDFEITAIADDVIIEKIPIHFVRGKKYFIRCTVKKIFFKVSLKIEILEHKNGFLEFNLLKNCLKLK